MKDSVTEDYKLHHKHRQTLEKFFKTCEYKILSASTDRSQISPCISGEFRCQGFTDVCL